MKTFLIATLLTTVAGFGAMPTCPEPLPSTGCAAMGGDCPDGNTFVPGPNLCVECTMEGEPIDTAEQAASLDPPAEFCFGYHCYDWDELVPTYFGYEDCAAGAAAELCHGWFMQPDDALFTFVCPMHCAMVGEPGPLDCETPGDYDVQASAFYGTFGSTCAAIQTTMIESGYPATCAVGVADPLLYGVLCSATFECDAFMFKKMRRALSEGKTDIKTLAKQQKFQNQQAKSPK